jgi:hypothetical protein
MAYTAAKTFTYGLRTYAVGDELSPADWAVEAQAAESVPMPGYPGRTVTLDAITESDGTTELDALVTAGLATGP